MRLTATGGRRLVTAIARRDWFLERQVLQLALTANALRPVPGPATMFPTFVAGWLTSELAPHLAGVTALDAGVHATRHGLQTPRDVLGTLAAAGNLAAFAGLLSTGRRAASEIEDALVEALGPDYREHITRDPLPDDIRAPWRSLVMPFRVSDPTVTAVRDLPYAPDGRRTTLNVYHHRDRPAGAPVLLQVHGGAWRYGNKDQQGVPLMLHMAARGWVCVAPNYPLSPHARWPEHLIALKRAVAWIRENGERYGADPSFVAVTGGSAGGHLAAMLALTAGDATLQPGFEHADTSVQAAAPHYGVYDFTRESGTPHTRARVSGWLRPLVMAHGARYPDDYRGASPLYRVTADAPPFLVVHGHNDSIVPIVEARAFVDRLRAVSANPVGYAEIAGAQHAFDLFPSLRSSGVVRGVARFLEWCHATRAQRPAPLRAVVG